MDKYEKAIALIVATGIVGVLIILSVQIGNLKSEVGEVHNSIPIKLGEIVYYNCGDSLDRGEYLDDKVLLKPEIFRFSDYNYDNRTKYKWERYASGVTLNDDCRIMYDVDTGIAKTAKGNREIVPSRVKDVIDSRR